ncbi:exodeoxyribonuclease VII small subunit [Neoehrlichia mikurensis]|uniref:Exodeoxyribonuclease VII small subunit n=1 Tax=Neoehrlichia mikurensis TaxID=89586 RepID=A0A9Q9BYS3_9RICK|nr:exodeoxyribonuclease VII small subunit [Neoehrlichia mikurensis]QXK92199.1 exodeoxyribonuclease VII small subunit [Neoehrlichia mikurensis]QXK92655.1 exodeoxyribonuclease VII small subunit [Neoehrlichia mikurensis]QXK93892.1 exodeoxyribonuclease VII small subunit [Neoehrlichia mikurensis]UTO55110.1 exodeoxyribonuclease VII small subunit [Neoehrlichia mikurensis]UTO56029.1 exodeoxyribonuclease VII small subunit [Neoehrlichia mikurensis]
MSTLNNNALTFESAMHELEVIVQELESSSISLERSMQLYERGKSLYEYCLNVIKGMELKIETIS